MVGLISYGAYIPLHRISREEFFQAWGGFAIPGEKAVANFDEDSITMAVESAIDSMMGTNQEKTDALFFASTTSPYKEKMGSAIISTALDMPPEVRTADFTGSLRVGTIALGSALDAIKAGSARRVLLAVADTRIGAPAGDFEQTLGDGAAALLLGEGDVIAEITDSYSISDEFSGVWRADGDTFLRSWEDRMVLDEGYSRILPQAISELMRKCNLTAKDFTKVVYDAPTDVRRHMRVATQLGFEPGQVQDPMFMTVGNTGAALATMMLAAALEEAKPDNRILFASYGNGADAFILKVTKAIGKLGERRAIRKHLESKRMVKNYQTYLRWRGLLTLEAARRPEQAPTSISGLWRHRREILALCGARCTSCGTPQYNNPGSLGHSPARVCVVCQAKDQFEPYRFADKKAEVFTFTQDNLTAHADPPATVAVVDFEGGGRAEFEMTDRDPAQVEIGMPVEMTFRKLYHDPARGVHNYYWKTRPIRC